MQVVRDHYLTENDTEGVKDSSLVYKSNSQTDYAPMDRGSNGTKRAYSLISGIKVIQVIGGFKYLYSNQDH